jgi:hypothetical protein
MNLYRSDYTTFMPRRDNLCEWVDKPQKPALRCADFASVYEVW